MPAQLWKPGTACAQHQRSQGVLLDSTITVASLRLQAVPWLSCCCIHRPARPLQGCLQGCLWVADLLATSSQRFMRICEEQSSLWALQTVCKGPLPAACCLPQLLTASYRLCMAACETAEHLPMRMVSTHCHPSCRWLSLSLLGACAKLHSRLHTWLQL